LSDNGGAHNNGSSVFPLKGWKGNEFEGGIRVPMIVWWPKVIQGGKTYTGISSSLDIFMTALKAAGGSELSYHADGNDLMPYLKAGDYTMNIHNELYWRKDQMAAARIGDYKLISLRDGQSVLYNVQKDPTEQNDFWITDTSQAHLLQSKLKAWETQLKMPIWIEPANWNTVTRMIGEDLMNNRPIRVKEPGDLKNLKQ